MSKVLNYLNYISFSESDAFYKGDNLCKQGFKLPPLY